MHNNSILFGVFEGKINFSQKKHSGNTAKIYHVPWKTAFSLETQGHSLTFVLQGQSATKGWPSKRELKPFSLHSKKCKKIRN